MKTEALLRALLQEWIWVALNLFGIVYFIVRTWVFTTPMMAVSPSIFEFGQIVLPIIVGVFLLNLIWGIVVVAGISRNRRPFSSLLVILFAASLWTGAFFYMRARITEAEREAQSL